MRSLFLVVIKFWYDATNALAIMVSQESVFRPFLHEIAVSVDRVGLRQFFFNKANDSSEILFRFEIAEFNKIQS